MQIKKGIKVDLNTAFKSFFEVITHYFHNFLKVSCSDNIIQLTQHEKIDISVIFSLKMTKSGMRETQKKIRRSSNFTFNVITFRIGPFRNVSDKKSFFGFSAEND